jgi:hypothetical protein
MKTFSYNGYHLGMYGAGYSTGKNEKQELPTHTIEELKGAIHDETVTINNQELW